MPDIGVLSLQIHSESTQAENSLRRLEGALIAIKSAVKGNGLNSFANALKKINENFSIHTVTNMNGLAAAMKKVQEACNFTVPNMSGLNRVRAAMSGVAQSAKEVASVQTAADGISDGFNVAESRVIAVKNTISESTEKVRKETEALLETLQKPVDYSHIQEYMDAVTGVTNRLEQTSEESAKALSVAAMDKDGPFVYAADEIMHYSEMLNKAKENLSFWENEYAKTAKAIKYNGATEERKNALGHAEEGFYFALQQVEEYEKKINDVKEYVAALDFETGKVVEKQKQYNDLCDDAIKKAAELSRQVGEKYANTAKRAFTNITENSLFAASLRGDLGEKQQFAAFRAEASHTGETIEEVEARVKKAMIPIKNIRSQIQELFNTLERKPKINLAEGIDRKMNINGPITDASESAAAFMSAMSDEASPLSQKLRELNPELAEMANEAKRMADTVAGEPIKALGNVSNQLEETKEKAKDASNGFKGVKEKMNELGKGIKAMFPHLSRIGQQFTSIARRMAIRAVIKQITSGFREGVENVYHYSKAVGTSFAPAMDSAASSLLQMKNSIGAAVAPAIQALIPILQSVTSWFIELVNQVNQFFALLNGQSAWTRALATSTEAYADSTKKAAGAAKDWLADFDELNVMAQDSGSSGASKTAEDYSKMFEEVTEFDGKVKELVEWIQDHMETVKGLAIATGVAILGWKLSRAFDGVVDTLGKIALGGALGVIGLTVAYEGAYAAGKNGSFTPETLVSTIAGNIATAVGGGIIGYKVAGVQGAVYGAVIGLTIGLATTLVAYNKGKAESSAKLAFANSGVGGIDPNEYLKALQTELDHRTRGAKIILNAYVDVPDIKDKLTVAAGEIVAFNKKVFSGDGELTDEEVASFSENWTQMLSLLDDMSKKTYETLLGGVISALSSDNEQLRKEAEEARINLIMARDNVSKARAEWTKEMEDLKDKILSGKASDDEKKLYMDKLQLAQIEQMGSSYTEGVDAILENVNALNFGNADTALDNAKEFIASVGSMSFEALQTITQARKAAIDSAEIDKREIEKLKEYFTPEEYSGNMEAIDMGLQVNLKFLTESENEIRKKTQSAYDLVFEQVAGVYKGLNNKQGREYWNAVIEPLLDEARKNGFKIPESIAGLSPDRMFANAIETILEDNADGLAGLAYEVGNEVANALFGDDMIDLAIKSARMTKLGRTFFYRMFGNGGQKNPLENSQTIAQYASEVGREETYRKLFDQYLSEQGLDDVSQVMSSNWTSMFASIFGQMEETFTQQGLENLTGADINDIVNSMLQILPEYQGAALIKYLISESAYKDTEGNAIFDLQDILSGIDWSLLSTREGKEYGGGYEYSVEEFVDAINSLIEEYNRQNKTPIPLVSGTQMHVNPGNGLYTSDAENRQENAAAVKEGTTDISNSLAKVERLLGGILAKQGNGKTVVVPTSAFGKASSISAAMYALTTGNEP